MTSDETATWQASETVWGHCVTWADLMVRYLIEYRVREGLFTEEDAVALTGVDRPLVVTTLAAAIHAQAVKDGLDGSPEDAAGVRLAAPDDGGLTGTLRRRPYEALQSAPRVTGTGHTELSVLLTRAKAEDPDGRLLWHRARTAAADAVEAAAAGLPGIGRGAPWWERGHTIGDVIDAWALRREAARAADL